MSNFKLLPFAEADLNDAMDAGARAFKEDGINCAVFPQSRFNPEDPLAQRRFRIDRYYKSLKTGTYHHFKAVDENASGQLVGSSGWFGPGGAQWMNDPVPEGEDRPACIDPEMAKLVNTTMKEGRDRVLKGNHNVWCTSHPIQVSVCDCC